MAEVSILGKILRFPDRMAEIVASMRAEHFYAASDQILFEEVKRLYETGAPSVQRVQDHLEHAGKLEMIGGIERIMDLVDGVVSMVGADSEAQAIVSAASRRSIAILGQRMVSDSHEEEDADALVSSTLAEFGRIANGTTLSASRTTPAAALLGEVLSNDEPQYLPTGLPWFDRAYTPRPGHLCVLAGFSGGGKTALAGGIAASMSLHGCVLVASLEMSAPEIVERVIPWCVDVPFRAVTSRTLTDEQRAAARLAVASRRIEITTAGSIGEIEQHARSMRINGGLRAIIVDYIQLVDPPAGEARASRAAQVSAITRSMKRMAGRLGCVVFGLSQLNNEASKEGIPQLHQLKESGSIRQDADAVAMVYPPDPSAYKQARGEIDRARLEGREDSAREARIIAARRVLDFQKVRNGPQISIPLMFEGRFVRFREATQSEMF